MMINSIISSIIYLFTFLFPIFFLPITSEFYEYNKMMLLIVTAVSLLILNSFKIAITKTFTFAINSFTMLLFLLATIFLISTFLAGDNIIPTLITPLSTSTVVFGFILYLLLINLVKPDMKERIMTILIISSCILAIYSILLFSGIVPKTTFTPAGNLLTTAIFLGVIAVYVISRIIRFLHPRGVIALHPWGVFKSYLFPYLLSFFLIGIGIALLTLTLTTNQKPIFLNYKYSLEILAQVMKDPKTLFLGVGPTKFVAAFTLGKPASINYTPFWNYIFTSSSSYLINITTEVGILAGSLYIFILLKALISLLQKTKKSHNNQENTLILNTGDVSGGFTLNGLTMKGPPARAQNIGFEHLMGVTSGRTRKLKSLELTLLFSLLIQIFLPSNMPVFITIMILFALSSDVKQLFSLDLSKLNILAYLAIIPSLAISTLILYFFGKIYLAEVNFKNGLSALSQNQGSLAYSYVKKAIDLNTNIDRYRVTFSQTSLALANALAQQKEVSDENKQNIPKLVQQAIDQARIATSLNQTSIHNWDNLARTYSSLTNFAEGSSDWAIEAYKQKITLDPNNPLARFDLGSFYLNQKSFSDAEILFKEAINLKKDYPNFHYNLAVSLREQKKYKEAYDEFKVTLQLLPIESEDRKKVEEEIKDLENSLRI